MARRGTGEDFTLEKALPNNVEAERYILGAILLENTTLNQAAERLKPEDFFLVSHRRIFEKMLNLFEAGRGIDPITLQEELRRGGELDLVGGPAYLSSLFDGVPRFSNIENYVKIVKGKSTLRRLINASNHIMAKAFDDEDSPEEILDEAERLILAIAEDRIKQGFVHIGEVAAKQLEVIEEIAGREQLITGIATGFSELDYMTSGLQRGDLIIVAARPSMGKCLAADSEIVLANGEVVTIEEVYRRQEARLLTLGSDFKFTQASPSAFVDDGVKPLYRVTTRLGRTVESTLAHPYLTIHGWRRLEELSIGDRIAVPRRIPVFGNALLAEEQIERLALVAVRMGEVSPPVFQLPRAELSLFLRQLFSICGQGVPGEEDDGEIRYETGGERLARQLQHLLLRFGILGRIFSVEERANWRLDIFQADSIRRFQAEIRAVEESDLRRREAAVLDVMRAPLCTLDSLRSRRQRKAWGGGEAATPGMAAMPGEPVKQATANWLSPVSRARQRAGRVPGAYAPGFTLPPASQAVGSVSPIGDLFEEELRALSQSDVYWDEIVSIEYRGEGQVYDLTIPETHNFVANDICVHNTAFSLNIAQNAATTVQHHGEPAVVGVFSLEMGNEQLVNRLLCSQARVDAHRLRSGYLSKEEWRRLATGVGELSQAQIFLDDTPGISVLEMRAKARRLKNEQKRLDMLIVDYLQLMTGRGKTDSRQQEVSQISRELKMLAKELNVPLIALSQLSRAPETRTGNHKPQLSDLRESGCLTGETLITLADSGRRVAIRDLVGQSGFRVWALNEQSWRIEPAVVSRSFSTGVKPVFRLTTRLGRTIRATANHPFRAFDGWKRLDGLIIGDRIAVPRSIENDTLQTMADDELALLGHLIGDGCTLPRHSIQYTTRERDLADLVASLGTSLFGGEIAPRIVREREWYQVYLASTRHHTHHVRSPIAEWLDNMGIWGLRSYEKRIPDRVFEQPPAAIAIFIRHLWVTDGCIRSASGGKAYPQIYYASSSCELARGVQSLLLRVGVNASLRVVSQKGKGRDQYQIWITGKQDIARFVEFVGSVGAYKTAHLDLVRKYLEASLANTNRDIIPADIWRTHVVPAMKGQGISTRQMMASIETAYCGTQIYKQNVSRDRAARIAKAVNSEELMRLAQSEVYWEEVVAIEPEGEEEVFDLTVEERHNFVAEDIIVHNSIEQDADVVMFIYREEVYKPETEKQNIAEIIIGKQRNGPIGSVELVFLKSLTRFEDKYREHAPEE